jgi:hypothetical protein
MSNAEAQDYLDRFQPHALICGTSTRGTFELELIERAQRSGIRTASLFDHWTDFDRRLRFQDRSLRPDSIFVIDETAKQGAIAAGHAAECIHMLGHPYLNFLAQKGYQSQVSAQELRKTLDLQEGQPMLVFISDSLSEISGSESAARQRFGYSELDSLRALLQRLQLIAPRIAIVVKPHPHEKRCKFDSLKNIKVSQSPLLDLLSAADYAAGMFSTGMLEAIALGHRPLRIEPGARDDLLPVASDYFAARLVSKAVIDTLSVTDLLRCKKDVRVDPIGRNPLEALETFLA